MSVNILPDLDFNSLGKELNIPGLDALDNENSTVDTGGGEVSGEETTEQDELIEMLRNRDKKGKSGVDIKQVVEEYNENPVNLVGRRRKSVRKTGATMGREQEYIDALNEDLSKELTSIIMYRWQGVVVAGAGSRGLPEFLTEMSEDEIHHAEGLAEKIDYFGGMPTFKLDNPILHDDPVQILQEDVRREQDAIDTYKRHIELFSDEPGVQWLLQEFMHDEEGHLAQFRSLLDQEQTSPTQVPQSNVMPLPDFLQQPQMQPAGQAEEELPGVITVIPRIAAFADYLGRRNPQEASLLIQALTNKS